MGNDGISGKKPPAGLTLILCKTRVQAGIEGLRTNIWGDDDYSVIDGEIRVYRNASRANGGGSGSYRQNRRRH